MPESTTKLLSCWGFGLEVLRCPEGSLKPILDIDLLVDIVDVCLDCIVADTEVIRDFGVVLTGEQLE